jgi:hypothetical protein
VKNIIILNIEIKWIRQKSTRSLLYNSLVLIILWGYREKIKINGMDLRTGNIAQILIFMYILMIEEAKKRQ